MKNKILLLLSMMVIFLFVVSCAPQMTDEELKAELAKLTPEERAELLADLEAKESGSLAGQAVKAKYVGKVSARLLTAKPALVRSAIATLPSATVGQTTCSDTDADAANPTGLDEFKKGTLTWSGGSYEDACGNDKTLRENYCSAVPNGQRMTKTVLCSDFDAKLGGTWKCVDGACKKQEPAELIVESADFSLVLNATTGKDDVKYTAVVKNIGLGDAGGFANRVYVKFALGSGVPTVNHHLGTSSLSAGSSVTLSGSYSPYNSTDLSKTVCPGTHVLNITADYTNTVAESDETNNGKQLTVTC